MHTPVAAVVVGRWNAASRDQVDALVLATRDADHVVVAVSDDDAPTTHRPLRLPERREIAAEVAGVLGGGATVLVPTTPGDDDAWVRHVRSLAPLGADPVLVTANPQSADLARRRGLPVRLLSERGATPTDVVDWLLRNDTRWRRHATEATRSVYTRAEVVQRVSGLVADVNAADGELSHMRDFETYGALMDGAVRQKVSDVSPLLPHTGEVIDKGCGTGAVLQALSHRRPGLDLTGVDLSASLLRRADQRTYANHRVRLLRGDATQPVLRDRSARAVLLLSVLHEVYSYNDRGAEAVASALRAAGEDLAPGGRVVVRDGVAPDTPDRLVWVWTDDANTPWLQRYIDEFSPGRAQRRRDLRRQGRWTRLRFGDAAEFLAKKDYHRNWSSEILEHFTAYTAHRWRDELLSAGFSQVSVRTYRNSWIVENRYRGQVAVAEDRRGQPGRLLHWPPTTVVVSGVAP